MFLKKEKEIFDVLPEGVMLLLSSLSIFLSGSMLVVVKGFSKAVTVKQRRQ